MMAGIAVRAGASLTDRDDSPIPPVGRTARTPRRASPSLLHDSSLCTASNIHAKAPLPPPPPSEQGSLNSPSSMSTPTGTKLAVTTRCDTPTGGEEGITSQGRLDAAVKNSAGSKDTPSADTKPSSESDAPVKPEVCQAFEIEKEIALSQLQELEVAINERKVSKVDGRKLRWIEIRARKAEEEKNNPQPKRRSRKGKKSENDENAPNIDNKSENNDKSPSKSVNKEKDENAISTSKKVENNDKPSVKSIRKDKDDNTLTVNNNNNNNNSENTSNMKGEVANTTSMKGEVANTPHVLESMKLQFLQGTENIEGTVANGSSGDVSSPDTFQKRKSSRTRRNMNSTPKENVEVNTQYRGSLPKGKSKGVVDTPEEKSGTNLKNTSLNGSSEILMKIENVPATDSSIITTTELKSPLKVKSPQSSPIVDEIVGVRQNKSLTKGLREVRKSENGMDGEFLKVKNGLRPSSVQSDCSFENEVKPIKSSPPLRLSPSQRTRSLENISSSRDRSLTPKKVKASLSRSTDRVDGQTQSISNGHPEPKMISSQNSESVVTEDMKATIDGDMTPCDQLSDTSDFSSDSKSNRRGRSSKRKLSLVSIEDCKDSPLEKSSKKVETVVADVHNTMNGEPQSVIPFNRPTLRGGKKVSPKKKSPKGKKKPAPCDVVAPSTPASSDVVAPSKPVKKSGKKLAPSESITKSKYNKVSSGTGKSSNLSKKKGNSDKKSPKVEKSSTVSASVFNQTQTKSKSTKLVQDDDFELISPADKEANSGQKSTPNSKDSKEMKETTDADIEVSIEKPEKSLAGRVIRRSEGGKSSPERKQDVGKGSIAKSPMLPKGKAKKSTPVQKLSGIQKSNSMEKIVAGPETESEVDSNSDTNKLKSKPTKGTATHSPKKSASGVLEAQSSAAEELLKKAPKVVPLTALGRSKTSPGILVSSSKGKPVDISVEDVKEDESLIIDRFSVREFLGLRKNPKSKWTMRDRGDSLSLLKEPSKKSSKKLSLESNKLSSKISIEDKSKAAVLSESSVETTEPGMNASTETKESEPDASQGSAKLEACQVESTNESVLIPTADETARKVTLTDNDSTESVKETSVTKGDHVIDAKEVDKVENEIKVVPPTLEVKESSNSIESSDCVVTKEIINVDASNEESIKDCQLETNKKLNSKHVVEPLERRLNSNSKESVLESKELQNSEETPSVRTPVTEGKPLEEHQPSKVILDKKSDKPKLNSSDAEKVQEISRTLSRRLMSSKSPRIIESKEKALKVNSESKEKPLKVNSENKEKALKVNSENKEKALKVNSESKEKALKVNSESKEKPLKVNSENKEKALKVNSENKEKALKVNSGSKEKALEVNSKSGKSSDTQSDDLKQKELENETSQSGPKVSAKKISSIDRTKADAVAVDNNDHRTESLKPSEAQRSKSLVEKQPDAKEFQVKLDKVNLSGAESSEVKLPEQAEKVKGCQEVDGKQKASQNLVETEEPSKKVTEVQTVGSVEAKTISAGKVDSVQVKDVESRDENRTRNTNQTITENLTHISNFASHDATSVSEGKGLESSHNNNEVMLNNNKTQKSSELSTKVFYTGKSNKRTLDSPHDNTNIAGEQAKAERSLQDGSQEDEVQKSDEKSQVLTEVSEIETELVKPNKTNQDPAIEQTSEVLAPSSAKAKEKVPRILKQLFQDEGVQNMLKSMNEDSANAPEGSPSESSMHKLRPKRPTEPMLGSSPELDGVVDALFSSSRKRKRWSEVDSLYMDEGVLNLLTSIDPNSRRTPQDDASSDISQASSTRSVKTNKSSKSLSELTSESRKRKLSGASTVSNTSTKSMQPPDAKRICLDVQDSEVQDPYEYTVMEEDCSYKMAEARTLDSQEDSSQSAKKKEKLPSVVPVKSKNEINRSHWKQQYMKTISNNIVHLVEDDDVNLAKLQEDLRRKQKRESSEENECKKKQQDKESGDDDDDVTLASVKEDLKKNRKLDQSTDDDDVTLAAVKEDLKKNKKLEQSNDDEDEDDMNLAALKKKQSAVPEKTVNVSELSNSTIKEKSATSSTVAEQKSLGPGESVKSIPPLKIKLASDSVTISHITKPLPPKKPVAPVIEISRTADVPKPKQIKPHPLEIPRPTLSPSRPPHLQSHIRPQLYHPSSPLCSRSNTVSSSNSSTTTSCISTSNINSSAQVVGVRDSSRPSTSTSTTSGAPVAQQKRLDSFLPSTSSGLLPLNQPLETNGQGRRSRIGEGVRQSQRASVRQSEANNPYRDIALRKFHNFTQIILSTSTTKMKNSFNSRVLRELCEALNILRRDESVKMVLLTATGPTFCQGVDLTVLQHPNLETRKKNAENLVRGIKEFLKTLVQFPKPIVAGVNGNAMGLGVTMLPLFDLVIANDKAEFFLPYAKLGQIPEGGATYTFPNLFGKLKSTQLFLGHKVTASMAKEIGLASESIWPATYQQELIPKVALLAAQSAQSMEATKALMNHHLITKLELSLESECRLLLQHWTSPHFAQLCKRFLESHHIHLQKPVNLPV